MERRTLWLLVGIGGGALAACGFGGGLLALVFMLASERALTATETLPLAGVMGVSLGFGVPLVVHGASAWRARPSRPFSPPRVWPLWLAWIILIILGAVVSLMGLSPAALLPPIHVLAMSMPPLITLWSAGQALDGMGGSWREVVAAMVSGGSLGLGLSFAGEALMGLALFVIVMAVAWVTPGGKEQIIALGTNLQDPTWVQDLSNLAELLLSPPAAVAALSIFAIPIPLIEEAFKTLAAGVVARWARPHPARAFLWGVGAGAGFALVENVFNGALGGAEGWPVGAVARLGATLMHCATGGLVGWGWGQLWAKRRPLRLVGSYIGAVLIHGVWNAITVSTVLLSASALAHDGNAIWLPVTGLGTLISVGLIGLMAVTCALAIPWAGRKLAAEARQMRAADAAPGPYI
jgi:RsiW-degrading membrane proteinase PrsW (M82 family)